MTQQFASIELARLYESQGYIEDALAMYKTLEDEGQHSKDSEIRGAINRLEAFQAAQSNPAPVSGESDLRKTIAEVNGPPPGVELEQEQELEISPRPVSILDTEPEKRIARLLEKWLMLMVVQKRVRVFKGIRARV